MLTSHLVRALSHTAAQHRGSAPRGALTPITKE
jgi:hypothetical protein